MFAMLKSLRTMFFTCVAVVATCSTPAVALAGGTLIRTNAGLLHGFVNPANASVDEFLGIPFAAPPVGALRWQPPQPTTWVGILQATQFGSACPQPLVTFGVSGDTNESCLYLNVFAPTGTRQNLPVMLWLYGGSYVGGSANGYDGSPLLAAGKVIVVTINYRVGVLGFLAHPALGIGRPNNESGDYGLMDQIAALQWVHNNIGAFGGNPGNVTLFGESAGGGSTIDQLTSPEARGLFEHAIIESGGGSSDQPTMSAAETSGVITATALGCPGTDATTAACLRALPVSTIVASESNNTLAPTTQPDIGPAVLPIQTAEAFGQGRYNRVPVLAGSNHDEGRLFVAFDYDFVTGPLSPSGYDAAVVANFGATLAPAVEAEYPLSAYSSPDLALGAALTDGLFSCPAISLDSNLALFNLTFAYEFADEQAGRLLFSDPFMDLGAPHASEIPFIWPTAASLAQMTPAEVALSFQMRSAWTHFATYGNPNGASVPFWLPHIPFAGNVEELVPDGTSPTWAFKIYHKCQFWAASGT